MFWSFYYTKFVIEQDDITYIYESLDMTNARKIDYYMVENI